MEALDEVIITTLSGIIETASQAKTFILAETPEVVQQALMFYGIYYTFLAFIGVVFLPLNYWYHCKLMPRLGIAEAEKFKGMEDKPFTYAIGHALGGSILAMITVALLSNFKEALKIWVAPKLWLIEYASDLLKS